jgi:hypothetical protein
MALSASNRRPTMSPIASERSWPANEIPSLKRPSLLPLQISRLYVEASADFKTKLLECLMRPMGALGLVAVADGVFAMLRHRHGWQRLQVTAEDTFAVSADHVYQLAGYLQESAPEVFRQVGQLLADNPAALATVSGVLLLQALRAARSAGRA